MTDKSVLRVADVMEQDYAIVEGVATVAEALAVMKEKNAQLLIVAKRHEDDEFGVVLIRDIAEHVLAPNRSPERTNVYEIMTKPVITVPPDMDIRYVARLLHRMGVRKAPVEERGELVGVISMSDLVIREGVL